MYWEDFGRTVLWVLIQIAVLGASVIIYTDTIRRASPEQYVEVQITFIFTLFIYITLIVLFDRIYQQMIRINDTLESMAEKSENIADAFTEDEE